MGPGNTPNSQLQNMNLSVDVGSGSPIVRERDTVHAALSHLNGLSTSKTPKISDQEIDWRTVKAGAEKTVLNLALDRAKDTASGADKALLEGVKTKFLEPAADAFDRLAVAVGKLGEGRCTDANQVVTEYKEVTKALKSIDKWNSELSEVQRALVAADRDLAREVSTLAEHAAILGRMADGFAKIALATHVASNAMPAYLDEAKDDVNTAMAGVSPTPPNAIEKCRVEIALASLGFVDAATASATPPDKADVEQKIVETVKAHPVFATVDEAAIIDQAKAIAAKLIDKVIAPVQQELNNNDLGAANSIQASLTVCNTIVDQLGVSAVNALDSFNSAVRQMDSLNPTLSQQAAEAIRQIYAAMKQPTSTPDQHEIFDNELVDHGNTLHRLVNPRAMDASGNPNADLRRGELASAINEIRVENLFERVRRTESASAALIQDLKDRLDSMDSRYFPSRVENGAVVRNTLLDEDGVVVETFRSGSNDLCVRVRAKEGKKGELTIKLGKDDGTKGLANPISLNPNDPNDKISTHKQLAEYLTNNLQGELGKLFVRDGRQVNGKSDVFQLLKQMSSLGSPEGAPEISSAKNLLFHGEKSALSGLTFSGEMDNVEISNCWLHGTTLEDVIFSGLKLNNNDVGSFTMEGCVCSDHGGKRSEMNGNTGSLVTITGLEGGNMSFRNNVFTADSTLNIVSHDAISAEQSGNPFGKLWRGIMGGGVHGPWRFSPARLFGAGSLWGRGAFEGLAAPKEKTTGAAGQYLGDRLTGKLSSSQAGRIRRANNDELIDYMKNGAGRAMFRAVPTGQNEFTDPRRFNEHIVVGPDRTGFVVATSITDKTRCQFIPFKIEPAAGGAAQAQMKALQPGDIDGIGGIGGYFAGLEASHYQRRNQRTGARETVRVYEGGHSRNLGKDNFDKQFNQSDIVALAYKLMSGELAQRRQSQEQAMAQAQANAAAQAQRSNPGAAT